MMYEAVRAAAIRQFDDVLNDILARCDMPGSTIYVVGCGGSHAQADHFVGELLGGMTPEGKAAPPIRAVNLAADSAFLTAWSNDSGFAGAFARRLAVARPDDVLVALSTSGRSPSVLAAIRVARSMGLATCAIVGESGCAEAVDHELRIPAMDTRTIQELTLCMLHELALRLGA